MTVDQKTLLELAAKAYDDKNIIKGLYPTFQRYIGENEDLGCGVFVEWNPLTDDGDALRLAVKLKLTIEFDKWDGVEFSVATKRGTHQGYDEVIGDDSYEATRRAIVRAAAEVGKGMLTQDEFIRMFPGRFDDVTAAAAIAEQGEKK